MTLAKPIPAVPVWGVAAKPAQCGLNLQLTSMIHPDTPHDPWFGRQRYTMIHPDHVVSLSRPGVCYVCPHRSSQASYIDMIWFTESIIHHIKSYIYIHPVIIMDFLVCWSTWNVARSRWRTPCEANHHSQQPHPRHGGRQRCGRMEQWIYAGWMMLVFSEQNITNFSPAHWCSWRSDCQDDISLRQIVGACPRSRMRLKLRQLHSGNFQQYTYTYQININCHMEVNSSFN